MTGQPVRQPTNQLKLRHMVGGYWASYMTTNAMDDYLEHKVSQFESNGTKFRNK